MPATIASAEIAGAAPSLSSRARSIIAAARSIASVRFSHRRRARRVDLDEQGPADLGLLVEEVQQPAERAPQAAAPGRLSRRRLAHRQLDPGRPGVEGLQVAVFLELRSCRRRLVGRGPRF